MSNFRSVNNEVIDYDTWVLTKKEQVPVVTTVVYNEVTISVIKAYFGTTGTVFKVYTEAPEDTKYYRYVSHFDGNTYATNDYNRVIYAIQNDLDVKEETYVSEDGNFLLRFDASNNKHLAIDRSSYPSIAYAYDFREEASAKYSELINGNG